MNKYRTSQKYKERIAAIADRKKLERERKKEERAFVRQYGMTKTLKAQVDSERMRLTEEAYELTRTVADLKKYIRHLKTKHRENIDFQEETYTLLAKKYRLIKESPVCGSKRCSLNVVEARKKYE